MTTPTPIPPTNPATPPANWYPDPASPAHLRWWDGVQWSSHVVLAQVSRQYRPVGVSTVLSIVGVVLVVVIEAVLALIAVPSFDSLGDKVANGSDQTLIWTVFDTVAFTGTLVMLAAGVASALWLWGARRNAEALRPAAPHARSRGWIWGSWVCPVVNLWFPYQCVRDVRRATDRQGRGRVGWWWAAYLVFFLLLSVAQSAGDFADTPSELRDVGYVAAVLHGLAALVGAVAAALWIITMIRVNRDQAAAVQSRTGTAGQVH